MPILNFKAEFAQKVESGEKKQTIRAKRKHPIRPVDKLYLYTGLRTKNARKLLETTCSQVLPIVIYSSEKEVKLKQVGDNGKVNDKYTLLEEDEILCLAKNDGFKTSEEFFEFFEKEYCFEGNVIMWS